jgi:hypothetical protein
VEKSKLEKWILDQYPGRIPTAIHARFVLIAELNANISDDLQHLSNYLLSFSCSLNLPSELLLFSEYHAEQQKVMSGNIILKYNLLRPSNP